MYKLSLDVRFPVSADAVTPFIWVPISNITVYSMVNLLTVISTVLFKSGEVVIGVVQMGRPIIVSLLA